MKKIIITGALILALSSCGTTNFETPEEALLDNQQEIVAKIQKISEMTPEQANSVGTMNFEISGQEGNVSSTINYNFDGNQKTGDASGNLDISVNGKMNQDLGLGFNEFAWNTNLDMTVLQNSIFMKLNELTITQPTDFAGADMVQEMVSAYLEKWYFFEDQTGEIQNTNLNMIAFEEKIYEILNTQPLFNHVSTNENQDFYDYVVELNSDTIVNITKEINALAATQQDLELTQQDFESIKQDIQAFNQEVEINLQISKKDSQYFVLNMKNDMGVASIQNSKNDLNITFESSVFQGKVSILGKKKLTGIEFNISTIVEEQEMFTWVLDITSNGKKTNMKLESTVNLWYQEVTFNMNLEDTTTQKTVEIVKPENAIDMNEAIMGLTGAMYGDTYVGSDTSFEDQSFSDLPNTENETSIKLDQQ